MRVRVRMLAWMVAAWLPIGASAQQAYLAADVSLYAGPQTDYPVVATLGMGTPVAVQGCLGDYTWCDVAVSDLRGWVFGSYLNYPYQSNWVPLATYGALIGVPILGFSLGSYWDRYYRGSPWYDDRWRWVNRPPAFHPAPPPPPGIAGRPGFAPPAFAPGRPGYAPPAFAPNHPGYASPAPAYRPPAAAPAYRPAPSAQPAPGQAFRPPEGGGGGQAFSPAMRHGGVPAGNAGGGGPRPGGGGAPRQGGGGEGGHHESR